MIVCGYTGPARDEDACDAGWSIEAREISRLELKLMLSVIIGNMVVRGPVGVST